MSVYTMTLYRPLGLDYNTVAQERHVQSTLNKHAGMIAINLCLGERASYTLEKENEPLLKIYGETSNPNCEFV